MTAPSHTLDRLDVAFDGQGLVANAGLVLPATLAHHVGLPEPLRRYIRLGRVAGAANPDVKALTAIASLLRRSRRSASHCRSCRGWRPGAGALSPR